MTAIAPDAPRLGFASKLGYGLGATPSGVVAVGLALQTLQYYLNQVVGMSPLTTGWVLMASLTVDAIADPLIGQWSDNIRSRWGRRHPFIYVAAVLWGVSFWLMWNAPRTMTGASLLAFMLVLLVAVRVSGSLHDIPSNALTPELAPDYDARTTLQSYRWAFLVIGLAIMSYVLNAVFLRKDPHHPLGLLNREGYAGFGAVGGLFIFFTATLSALTTQGRVKFLHVPPKRRMTVGATAREMVQTMTHPALIVLMLCGLFGGVAAAARSGLDNYFYTHLWGLKPQQIALLLPLGVVGSAIAVVLAPILSKRLGKKMTMITFFTFSTIVSLIPLSLKLMGLMPGASSPWLLTILAIDLMMVAILALSGLIIISSMIADVVEDNAVRTGVRSEGLLFAMNGLLPKFTAGIGSVIAGALLTAVHFPDRAVQGSVPAELMRHLVVLFLPVYVVLVSLSIVVLLFYRIDKDAHQRNLATMREAAALAEPGLLMEAEAGVTPSGPITPAAL
jgi:GPH family glycoside/pentoside/hexuronide:cation symporter